MSQGIVELPCHRDSRANIDRFDFVQIDYIK